MFERGAGQCQIYHIFAAIRPRTENPSDTATGSCLRQAVYWKTTAELTGGSVQIRTADLYNVNVAL